MRTNLQVGIERQRAVYITPCSRPLLSQLLEVYEISIRDFARIFGISKSYAEEIINHKKLPSLELGIRIARYFEVRTDELFGWRVEDDGARRPLKVRLPDSKNYVTLKAANVRHSGWAVLQMIHARIAAGKREAKNGESGEVAESGESGVRDVSNVEAVDR